MGDEEREIRNKINIYGSTKKNLQQYLSESKTGRDYDMNSSALEKADSVIEKLKNKLK